MSKTKTLQSGEVEMKEKIRNEFGYRRGIPIDKIPLNDLVLIDGLTDLFNKQANEVLEEVRKKAKNLKRGNTTDPRYYDQTDFYNQAIDDVLKEIEGMRKCLYDVKSLSQKGVREEEKV
jgi:hypothetical protein